ncbi:MAG: Hsp20/alpha crystallin family protein, partial [Pseudomonadales bacterium]|nr:Hsp20/alpha crystallin family protein [Pseudomonadales bacterium]
DAGEAFEVIIPVAENAEIDVNTELEDNVLSISARMQHKQTSSTNTLLSSSTRISQFARQIPLPESVSPIGMSTERQGDQIVIRIPKQSQA